MGKYVDENGYCKEGYESEDNNPMAEKAAVNKGAKLLDRILPGWHNQVNLKKLQMSSGSMCMMGQLFGGKVESKLAREMYPEEMKDAEKRTLSKTDGYGKALCSGRDIIDGYTYCEHDNLVTALIKKNKLRITEKLQKEYMALERVCSGHDNSCFWAEEIAKRKVADAEADSSKTV